MTSLGLFAIDYIGHRWRPPSFAQHVVRAAVHATHSRRGPGRRYVRRLPERRVWSVGASIPRARRESPRRGPHPTAPSATCRLPRTRPPLLIARNTGPCVMAAAAVHAWTWLFTHVGMGTVRMCPPLPTRSAMTQCSSRCWLTARYLSVYTGRRDLRNSVCGHRPRPPARASLLAPDG